MPWQWSTIGVLNQKYFYLLNNLAYRTFQTDVLCLVSGILHIGNILFEEAGSETASVRVDESKTFWASAWRYDIRHNGIWYYIKNATLSIAALRIDSIVSFLVDTFIGNKR